MARRTKSPDKPAKTRASKKGFPEPARKAGKAEPKADAEAEVEADDGDGDEREDAEPLEGELLDADDADPDLDEAELLEAELGEGPDAEVVDAELEVLAFQDSDRDQGDAPPAGESKRRGSLARRDPLSTYVQETRRYPLLSREQEHELAIKWVEGGDSDAARRLIEANLRLVVKIAYEYRRAHRNLLDLVQEGNIGLMQAVRKYDPYRGVKLSSYAAWWIRAYILKFILNNWRLVKLGTTQAQRKLFFNLRKEREKLEQLGFTPSPALLAEKLDVRERDVIEMEKRLAAPDASMDAPVSVGEGEGQRTRHDFIAGQAASRPDIQVEEGEFTTVLRQKLEEFATTLQGREATIFRERWLTDEPLTLQEIGDRYGVSRERARQIEKRMLTRLRDYLEAELGTAVDIDALSRE